MGVINQQTWEYNGTSMIKPYRDTICYGMLRPLLRTVLNMKIKYGWAVFSCTSTFWWKTMVPYVGHRLSFGCQGCHGCHGPETLHGIQPGFFTSGIPEGKYHANCRLCKPDSSIVSLYHLKKLHGEPIIFFQSKHCQIMEVHRCVHFLGDRDMLKLQKLCSYFS